MDTPANIAATLRRAADFVEQNTQPQSNAIQTIVGLNGVVHVRPVEGLLGSRPHDSELLWNFGDPGTPRNQLPGFNAAHIYLVPGDYTVTLIVRHPAGVRSFQTTVHVPEATLQRTTAFPPAKLGNNTRLVLQRGTVYEFDRTIVVDGYNVLISAEGVGEPPVLRWTGRGQEMIRCGSGARDVLIRGVTFEAAGVVGDRFNIATAIVAAGRNIAVIDCTFTQVQDAINANGQPTGLLIANCRSGDLLHAYFCWVQGTDIVLFDNVATDSLAEHIVRVGGAQRLLCVGNRFTNRRKSCFNVQIAEQVWLEDNIVRGAWALGPLGGGDGKVSADRCRCVVVRGNDADTTFELKHGAEAVRFSGNLLRVDGKPAISVDGFSEKFARGVEQVELHRNTAVNTAETGSFLRIGGTAQHIEVVGNRYLAPHLRPGSHESAVLFILDHNADAVVVHAKNDWPDTAERNLPFAGDGLHYVWPTWSDKRGYRRSLGNG